MGGIFIVVYIDVLFIINFFISFLLLEMTALFCKKQAKTIRLILSSVFGGVYSFIILIDELPDAVLCLSKLVSAVIMVIIAFRFYRIKSFIRALFVFVSLSLALLGVVVGVFMLTKSEYIAINNSTVYFNISAKQLLLSALLAYVSACLIVRMYNRSVSRGGIYTLTIQHRGNEVSVFALSDTGNKLREPFSDAPVIVVDSKIMGDIFDESRIRLIPAQTISSQGVLRAFRPDRVILKTQNGREVLENVYIALSDDMNNDGFSAILNPEILSV